MYVRSQVRCSLPASRFGIEKEYVGGLSKAKCLYYKNYGEKKIETKCQKVSE